MGRALDTLHSKLDEIVNNPSLILDEDFMMNIFEEYLNELSPFKKYWDFMFNKKQIKLIARKSSAKVASFAMLRDELFHPIGAIHHARRPGAVQFLNSRDFHRDSPFHE